MGTYRQQDRRYRYEDNWEAFTAKLAAYTPKKLTSLVNDATVDQKLAMIVGLSADWRADYSTANAVERVRQAQARIIEERRMTPDPAAFRPYLDPDTRAMLPAIKLHRRYGRERWRDFSSARAYWKRLPTRNGERLAARERRSITQSMFAPPYGGPVTRDELNALLAMFRTMRPVGPVTRPAIDPAGMTPERALAIAHGVLGR